MTRRSFVAIVAATLAPWTGCGAHSEPPVRIGASVWPGFECLFIARSLGLLAADSVKLVEYTNTPEVVRAFKNRVIELATMSGDDFFRLAGEESDVRAVLVMDISKGADALVSKADYSKINELRGKKVGMEPNAVSAYMLRRALSLDGLTSEDVEIVPVDSDQHVAAFHEGRMDAVITFEPHRSKLLKNDARVLFDSSQIPGEIVNFLVTRQSLLQKQTDLVKNILKAWFESRERLLNEGEKVAPLVAFRERVSPSEFLKSLELLELPSLEKNRELLRGQGKSIGTLQKTYQAMVQNPFLRQTLHAPEVFNGGFLP